MYVYIYIYIYIYALPVKSIWSPSKIFISHPKSVIFNETSKILKCFSLLYLIKVFLDNLDISITRYLMKDWFEDIFLRLYGVWIKRFPKVTLYHHSHFYTMLCWIIAFKILSVLSLQRTISSESPVCVTENWLLQTSLYNWTYVMKKCVNIHYEESEVSLCGRIVVKKSLLREQNNVKRL